MSTQKKSIVFAMLVLAAAGLDAQSSATLVRQSQSVRFAEPWRPANTTDATKVTGQVLDINRTPVPYARVQLRNLQDGDVRQETEADANGEYAFNVDVPGTYVVEMIMLNGYVIGLSNALSLARFETVRTVVRLPGRWDGARGMVMQPNASAFFGMSSASTMTAQTVQIALQQSIQPVDAGEPVSPNKP